MPRPHRIAVVLSTGLVGLFASPVTADSCCMSDGSCQPLPLELCNIVQGAFVARFDCEDDPCSAGACCTNAGCLEVLVSTCLAQGGTWMGSGSVCDGTLCPDGACCFTLKGLPVDCDDGMTQEACELEGGSWLGPFSTCLLGVCDPVGACCITPTGECIEMTEVDCYLDLGINFWHGPGVSCNDVQCFAATGACCYEGNVCEDDVWEDLCWDTGGSYMGTGSTCSDVNCCPGDPNGDGLVNFNDVLLVLTSWGPCVNCPGDIDNSGHVSVADLLIVLANWGNCDPFA